MHPPARMSGRKKISRPKNGRILPLFGGLKNDEKKKPVSFRGGWTALSPPPWRIGGPLVVPHLVYPLGVSGCHCPSLWRGCGRQGGFILQHSQNNLEYIPDILKNKKKTHTHSFDHTTWYFSANINPIIFLCGHLHI